MPPVRYDRRLFVRLFLPMPLAEPPRVPVPPKVRFRRFRGKANRVSPESAAIGATQRRKNSLHKLAVPLALRLYRTRKFMQQRRTNLLLALLVITPLALLTWLGTYLIRDASRSTDAAMQAVLAERLSVADHQLVDDLRRFTDQLDEIAASASLPGKEAASALAAHPWVTETWVAANNGTVLKVHAKPGITPGEGADAETRSGMLRQIFGGPVARLASSEQPFLPVIKLPETSGVDRSRKAVWMTFARTEKYHLEGFVTDIQEAAFPSGWHVTDGDFIYWRQLVQGDIVCARLDSQKLRFALYSRLPPPGQPNYPGRLILSTVTGIPLFTSGQELSGSSRRPVSIHECSPPFTQWRLAYAPASKEFPKPYLFPILLGVGSGCLLVMAVAWTFFRENARELRLAQQRVSFVNQISHELKTPLTNIQLYSEMASHRIEDTGDSIALRHLKVVETETARLNRLIQNVLNYARQQRDRLTVQPRPIVLDEVVGRAIGNWRTILENKGFVVHTQFRGPTRINADADALEQILGNLLSNVDKYASHGKWVSVRTEVTEEATAQIIVEDRGPGVPASKRRMIFEPFERLRSDVNEGVSGTGIGLTISRELAELHGGSLEVCSQSKDGAKFVLTLPVQPL